MAANADTRFLFGWAGLALMAGGSTDGIDEPAGLVAYFLLLALPLLLFLSDAAGMPTVGAA